MPVNFLEVRDQINIMAGQARKHFDHQQSLLDQARSLLEIWSPRIDDLQALVGQAIDKNSHVRCAIPVSELPASSIPPSPSDMDLVVLAVDGSQITPSHHDAVQFGLVNIGAVRMCPGSGNPLDELVESKLLYFEDLVGAMGPLSEEDIALRRDLAERQFLVRLAEQEKKPIITLTDGPLELFHEPRERHEFQESFKKYLITLLRMAELDVIVAGYVDKPQADLVIRMLELTTSQENDIAHAENRRPLRGIPDALLYGDILPAGSRSAIFAIQSSSASNYQGALELHFFYLNVGREGSPYLVRVEIPAWVAGNANHVNLLHNVLLAQCSHLAGRAYPYVLHRAHEVAVVSFEEKEKLMEMIIRKLLGEGAISIAQSNKQMLKNMLGTRTRYKP
jgi:hypothetical protein